LLILEENTLIFKPH